MAQVSRHCANCGHKTLHEKSELSNGMGCLLTIVTGGIFIPFWIFYRVLILPFRKFVCQTCGKGRLT